jgi:hypothetical protein
LLIQLPWQICQDIKSHVIENLSIWIYILTGLSSHLDRNECYPHGKGNSRSHACTMLIIVTTGFHEIPHQQDTDHSTEFNYSSELINFKLHSLFQLSDWELSWRYLSLPQQSKRYTHSCSWNRIFILSAQVLSYTPTHTIFTHGYLESGSLANRKASFIGLCLSLGGYNHGRWPFVARRMNQWLEKYFWEMVFQFDFRPSNRQMTAVYDSLIFVQMGSSSSNTVYQLPFKFS